VVSLPSPLLRCYRVERTSSRAGRLPLWTSAFPRRTQNSSLEAVPSDSLEHSSALTGHARQLLRRVDLHLFPSGLLISALVSLEAGDRF
jgi:hypothetical protein